MSWVRDRTHLVFKLTDDIDLRGYKYNREVRVDLMNTTSKKTTSISLLLQQFLTLFHINELILKSIRSKTEFTYDLGDSVSVSYSEFKNKWTVGLRQYYLADDGKMTAGKWGVNICPTVWTRTISPRLPKLREYYLFYL